MFHHPSSSSPLVFAVSSSIPSPSTTIGPLWPPHLVRVPSISTVYGLDSALGVLVVTELQTAQNHAEGDGKSDGGDCAGDSHTGTSASSISPDKVSGSGGQGRAGDGAG